MNARPLFVRLIENRREIHRTSDAGALRTVVAADEACILNDELCAWRDRIGVIVHDRRKTIAGRRCRGVRAVTLIVVIVSDRRIVAAGLTGSNSRSL